MRDKEQAINVCASLGYAATVPFELLPGRSRVLPLTPRHYLDYEYKAPPFATSRHDRGFDVLRRLERDGRFHFDFYTFPSEYLILRMIPEYVATPGSFWMPGTGIFWCPPCRRYLREKSSGS